MVGKSNQHLFWKPCRWENVSWMQCEGFQTGGISDSRIGGEKDESVLIHVWGRPGLSAGSNLQRRKV